MTLRPINPALSHPLRTLPSSAREAPPSAVTDVTFEQQLTSTCYAVDDFNFETAATDLLATLLTFLVTKRTATNTRYVVQRVRHQATGTSCSSEFAAFPAATAYRPPRLTPKPFIPGTQTAIVSGPIGEEIYTDEYGRVKVQFHWDRRGQRGQHDQNSSGWIRVAQGWAGKSRGSLFIPGIGQEVVVTFLNGDPNRPLIIGSVYNSEQSPPYTLPGDKT